MEMEEVILGLIMNSGESRGMAFEALRSAREGDFQKSKELLKQADEKSIESHITQTDLIQKEAQGESTPVSLLMVHAQDHLMNSILAKELINEIIYLHEKIYKLESRCK